MVSSMSRIIAVALVVGSTSGALAQDKAAHLPSPPGASVYFETPTDGAHVGTTVVVRAGLHGMGVAPSGEPVAKTGHHHLLIDTDLAKLPDPLPVNNQIVHFSNGETETSITLSPGWHKLQLVLGDAGHANFSPPLASKPIRIYVAGAAASGAGKSNRLPGGANRPRSKAVTTGHRADGTSPPASHVLSKGHGLRGGGPVRGGRGAVAASPPAEPGSELSGADGGPPGL